MCGPNENNSNSYKDLLLLLLKFTVGWLLEQVVADVMFV